MIHFRSDIGRLGNQLFIYAFAQAVKKQCGQNYILSHMSGLRHFELGFAERILNWMKSQYFFRVARVFSPPIYRSYSDDQAIKDWQKDLSSGNVSVVGFFQSPKYFSTVEQVVKRRLKIKQSFYKTFDKKFKDYFFTKKVVAIHVRRTDYKNHYVEYLGYADYRLPIDYYKKALNKIQAHDLFYILVGDDKEFMENEFGFLPNKIVSKEDEITDFLILLHASICIISNSTFAWWGAYLNVNSNTRVLAPKCFLGYRENIEYPIGIYPEAWEQVSHNS